MPDGTVLLDSGFRRNDEPGMTPCFLDSGGQLHGVAWMPLKLNVGYNTRPCHHSDKAAARTAKNAATAANRAVISVFFFSNAIFAVRDW